MKLLNSIYALADNIIDDDDVYAELLGQADVCPVPIPIPMRVSNST